ncbi:MAG: VanZ family protein [Deltaproteobacteria bacterium]|nr:VanZ family protein [Deltaproteobacteria bacterium]
MTLRRFTYLYIAYLILSSAVARKGLEWLRGLIGAEKVHVIPWVFLGVALCLVVLIIRRNRISWPRILVVASTFVGIFLFLKGMRIPEERIHIFQYGLLGFLLVTSNREKSWKQTFVMAFFVVLLVAGADEVFQAFLPDRVGEIRDVGFGCLGGIWGILIAALTLKRGPSRPIG